MTIAVTVVDCVTVLAIILLSIQAFGNVSKDHYYPWSCNNLKHGVDFVGHNYKLALALVVIDICGILLIFGFIKFKSSVRYALLALLVIALFFCATIQIALYGFMPGGILGHCITF